MPGCSYSNPIPLTLLPSCCTATNCVVYIIFDNAIYNQTGLLFVFTIFFIFSSGEHVFPCSSCVGPYVIGWSESVISEKSQNIRIILSWRHSTDSGTVFGMTLALYIL